MKVWAQTHLVGQCETFFAGEKFHLSDHFGLFSYVDVGDVYASRAKQDVATARAEACPSSGAAISSYKLSSILKRKGLRFLRLQQCLQK